MIPAIATASTMMIIVDRRLVEACGVELVDTGGVWLLIGVGVRLT